MLCYYDPFFHDDLELKASGVLIKLMRFNST